MATLASPVNSPVPARRARLLVFPPYFFYGIIPLAILMMIGAHPLLGVLSIVILVLGTGLLWRPNEIPCLLFLFAYQWLEASMNIIRGSLLGRSLQEMTNVHGAIETATVLTLFGLLAIALGVRLSAGPSTYEASFLVRQQVLSVPIRKWLTAYIVSSVASLVILELARFAAGFAQPLLVLASIKWAFFLILTYAVWAQRAGYRLVWLLVFGFEFALSLGGYFSSFRLVFIFAFLGLMGAGAKLRPAQFLSLALLAAVAIFLGTIWTAIKVDYRNYVNQGTRAQVVLVNRTQQMQRIVELSTKLSSNDLLVAVESLGDRIAYTQYFGAAISYVPRIRPHTDGAITFDGLSRPFMPRLFFPEKTAIDESAHSSEFTGLELSGMEQGTQISIGYVGDAYIDYGRFGMIAALFVFGLILGLFYRRMTEGSNTRGIIGGALSSVLMVEVAGIGNGGLKVLGGLALWILVGYLFSRFVAPALNRRLGIARASAGARAAYPAVQHPRA